jgi:NAD(P)-dependent dehydrogenase (short-subunit alcohol dehydrogenase family)
MAVNVLAPRKLIAAASDRIPPGGAVVITASTAGNRYVDHLAEIQELLAISDWHEALAWVRDRPAFAEESYGFSKECAQVLTLQWAPMLLRRGIRLNSVCPGLIDTPLFSDFAATMGQPILDWMVSQSGGRRAAPAEVANVLAFIGSDAASLHQRIQHHRRPRLHRRRAHQPNRLHHAAVCSRTHVIVAEQGTR